MLVKDIYLQITIMLDIDIRNEAILTSAALQVPNLTSFFSSTIHCLILSMVSYRGRRVETKRRIN